MSSSEPPSAGRGQGVGDSAVYDELSAWYDERNRAAAVALAPELEALLPPDLGTCLVLGCGTGQYFHVLRPRARRLVGLDLSGQQPPSRGRD
ncbi:hypothetical protein GTR02_14455 [Kineococcus sp. R8]|uniref:hypothetical protein n=1 Tax=Kineococcus siccus TaxID=2696567 RepID=UPI001412EC0B|nr:hypothetical protein [Kineococcus siccus]NAZ83018.1 hypothetical protein [Kineococcus siccus]